MSLHLKCRVIFSARGVNYFSLFLLNAIAREGPDCVHLKGCYWCPLRLIGLLVCIEISDVSMFLLYCQRGVSRCALTKLVFLCYVVFLISIVFSLLVRSSVVFVY